MEETFPFHLFKVDILLSLLGFIFSLVDIALDIWAVVSLYQEGSYISLGLLIFLLLGSSVLLHVFSWIWYSDPSIILETKTEKFAEKYGLLGLLHICQLGMFLRCTGVVEIAIYVKQKDIYSEAVYLFMITNLSTLRLFETFSESIPQLILMIYTLTQEQDLRLVSVAKIAGSFATIAWSVTNFHRNMRNFVPEVSKMNWLSTLVYFLWNLFLLVPRVVSVALFTCALPCYFAIHFLCLWMLLVFWAWWQDTDFMDTRGGEWLYRATVGLIWYFSWFNVSSGRTKLRSMVYHLCLGVDMALLLALWWWKCSVESARQRPLQISPYMLFVVVPALYITGILLKMVYYWKFHPKNMEIRTAESPRATLESGSLATGMASEPEHQANPERSFHKRMILMAEHFYN
ncbi:XK-related protein 8-like [Brachyhypopomus gauderio]|uniref:XK-related protein 8-like n=1 Tax=Brachyhypopomus gauderio TaxID=698409 RepID=UPI00404197B3